MRREVLLREIALFMRYVRGYVYIVFCVQDEGGS